MSNPNNMWELQSYVAGLLAAHPQFSAAGLKIDNSQAQAAAVAAGQQPAADARGIVIEDGTYPKIPGMEAALKKLGLCLIVWRVGSIGLVDTAKTGVFNQLLHIAVVIMENGTVNRAPAAPGKTTPTGILPQQALQYVFQAVAGNPKGTPPGTPVIPHHEPFSDLGVVNGAYTIVVNFTKQHRITPL